MSAGITAQALAEAVEEGVVGDDACKLAVRFWGSVFVFECFGTSDLEDLRPKLGCEVREEW